jgi:hypothetical protein
MDNCRGSLLISGVRCFSFTVGTIPVIDGGGFVSGLYFKVNPCQLSRTSHELPVEIPGSRLQQGRRSSVDG